MRLLDTNIIIYIADPTFIWLREWVEQQTFQCSVITRIEALGYPQLNEEEALDIDSTFTAETLISIDRAIEDRAIAIRRQRKIRLGDALIAATALEFDLELVTRNVKDFDWIEGLKVINPFDVKAND